MYQKDSWISQLDIFISFYTLKTTSPAKSKNLPLQYLLLSTFPTTNYFPSISNYSLSCFCNNNPPLRTLSSSGMYKSDWSLNEGSDFPSGTSAGILANESFENLLILIICRNFPTLSCAPHSPAFMHIFFKNNACNFLQD